MHLADTRWTKTRISKLAWDYHYRRRGGRHTRDTTSYSLSRDRQVNRTLKFFSHRKRFLATLVRQLCVIVAFPRQCENLFRGNEQTIADNREKSRPRPSPFVSFAGFVSHVGVYLYKMVYYKRWYNEKGAGYYGKKIEYQILIKKKKKNTLCIEICRNK